jgi:hypothetical protein
MKLQLNQKPMKLPQKLLHVLILLCLIAVVSSVALATTESINVESGKEIARTIDLAAGDRTTMTFSVLGAAPSTLHFFMVLPNGTVCDYGEVSRFATDFFTDVKGECKLHFQNSNSSDVQLVTLNYDVEHYVFGIPQLIFLLIAIAALLLVAVAGYIIMGKYG